ncbi:MAG TPA: phage tail sheath C-terminal domain-containing protein [Longimicrobiaceae bacterium]|nr:phage tail sheath C-terminal domain-containing protein [Longimicrobiaceae bacterium]
MPVQVSYPGVYLQEIPSGVHTITGVATSITAFVGRTPRGPVDEPIRINSFADFQRTFGGLSPRSSVSYAVRDFFQNGGSTAVVVRVVGTGAARARLNLAANQNSDVALSAALTVARLALSASRVKDATANDVATAAERAARGYVAEPAKSAAAAVAKAVRDLVPASGNPPAPPALAKAAVDEVADAVEKGLSRHDEQMPDGAADVLKAIEDTLNKAVETASDETKTPAQVAADAMAAAGTSEPAKQVAQAAQEYVERRNATPTVDGVLDALFDQVPTTLQGDLTGAQPKTVPLQLEARSPGSWGNSLTVAADREGITPQVASSIHFENGPVNPTDLFNLTVRLSTPDGQVVAERYTNVSLREDAGAYRLEKVLEGQSALVHYVSGDANAVSVAVAQRVNGSAGDGLDSAPLDADDYLNHEATKGGLYALNKTDLFNLLCIPPDPRDDGAPADTPLEVYQHAAKYCQDRRAMLILDPPVAWNRNYETSMLDRIDPGEYYSFADEGRNAAVYFPRVVQPDPALGGHQRSFPASGAVAGVIARTDVTRGVWKAPAGLNAGISGISGLELKLTDAENGVLNPKGINCLRSFPVLGNLVWGARTLRGADQLADDYKYLPVRRLVLYIEESLYRGTQWAVFEPNDEPLWSQIRLNIGAFMAELFRQGAFQGSSPKDAYFVRCDSTTTTQNDINQGKVNVLVGFAPLKPAEFVIISIQQIAGQIPT